MGYSRKQLESKGFDEQAYQKYFSKHQQEHLRIRLRCLKSYFSGGTPQTLGLEFGIHQQTVRIYLQTYLLGGFEALCAPIKRPKSTLLSESQMAAFKTVLLDCRPNEVGLEGNIWTGKLMRQYLQNTYQIEYKSGIYDLLERLGLSHQKAHSDYANAKAEEQQVFLEDLKNTLLQADERTAVVKFDEFSVSSRPSSYYGWAQKNTRPKVKTDEKNASAQMAF
jgi:transposase